MNSSNKIKGNELEDAVCAIESFIFETEPSLKEATIFFETNKIVTLKGAKNEIDLFAKIILGRGYESIFIFECKNWNKKIGKNEIIIFSEKIREINAQKGFFMAKEYTKDAINRGKLDGRIELVKVNNQITADSFPISFFSPEITCSNLIFFAEIESRKYSSDEIFNLNGNSISLKELINKYCLELQNEIYSTDPGLMLEENNFEKEKIVYFNSGELSFEGKKIKGIKIVFQFRIDMIKPIVKSQYDVEARGRYITIEFEDVRNKVNLLTSFAQLT